MMATDMTHTFTMRLDQLLEGVVDCGSFGVLSVTGLNIDSRQIRSGDLFIAVSGFRVHGIAFAEQAISNGAVAILAEADVEQEIPSHFMTADGRKIPVLMATDLAANLGHIASRFFHYPSRTMQVTAITGTNGKSSVTHFVSQVLAKAHRCGVSGTTGIGLVGDTRPSTHTTPDAVALQRSVADMVMAGATHLAMEASSHALVQGRMNGMEVDCAVFTNLSHEHLDYHDTMGDYAEAKRALFECYGASTAVINLDDEVGRRWLTSLPSDMTVISYGFESHGETPTLLGSNLELSPTGIAFDVTSSWGNGHIRSSLLGYFNAENLLAALGALLAGGMSFDSALEQLTEVATVPGRMERFGNGASATVVVDYAHTPDALEVALNALKEHCRGKLWCVFGCGGDRDSGKRPLMGAIAERYSDYVIVTDDNPRSENPYQIIEQIQLGMHNADAAQVIRDRHQAIERAIKLAKPEDVILIAGKGHETTQDFGHRTIHFSDREQVAMQLGMEVDSE